MKIVAGLGAVDDYIRLVKAGADEVFCGYVPYEWNKKYGTIFPLNRREVLYYNVQIGSLEDMKILKTMVDLYKVPVSIAFNYLYYLEEQYEMILKIITDLMDIGFYDFIIADIALILYLKKNGVKASIHLSGECAEINSLSIDFLNELELSRYVFHRKNSISDMKSCIENNKVKNMQYEAFILNEKCHFTGAFCSSFHCDEMIHLCQMPYDLMKIKEGCNKFQEVDSKIEAFLEEDYEEEYADEGYVLGSTGCGICSLKALKDAGITHLKVVGRGNSIDNMERDVRNLKKALNMVENINDEIIYKDTIKENFFKSKCSGDCYYITDYNVR